MNTKADLIEIRNHKPRVFQLTWCINNICTNHCRYCPTMLHNGKNHHYEWRHAERFALELMEQHPNIQLSIAGGEPTVSPWLKDLINLFLDRGHTVGLTSNGVRAGHYWDDCRPDYICLSYHAAFDDLSWVGRAVETQCRIPHTTARIMMDPDRWSQCLAVFKILEKTNLGIEPVKIVNWGGGSKPVTYSAEQLEWLENSRPKKHPEGKNAKLEYSAQAVYMDGSTERVSGPWATRLIVEDRHYFPGWQCDIGLDTLFVQYDGSYRRGNCAEGGYIGRLSDPILKWPTTPVICHQHNCHCTTDIVTAKRMIPVGPVPVHPAAEPRSGSTAKIFNIINC